MSKNVKGRPVDSDIIKRFIELLSEAQPSLTEAMSMSIEQQLRHEYAGERVYIPKRDANKRAQIVDQFNGRNVNKLGIELGVSRRTIYRVIKKNRTVTS